MMKNSPLLVIVLVLASIFPALSQPSQAYEIPFQIRSGRVHFEARVNGAGPYNFMFDTGAEGMGRADTRLVQELSLPYEGRGVNDDGVNRSTIDLVRIQSLSIGSLSRGDFIVSSRDYNRSERAGGLLHGIVGRGFVEGFLVIISYPTNRMLLYRDASLRPEAEGVLTYTGGYRAPVKAGDLEFLARIDTGSSLTMHFPLEAADLLGVSDLRSVGIGSRANTEFQLLAGTIRRPIGVGSVQVEELEVLFSAKARMVNVGGRFLSRFVLVLDPRNKRLALVGSLADALQKIAPGDEQDDSGTR
ncbi:MAG TPA: aspartyl protease family protein [Acidobacteriota bacterium]|nr:aspartyl protease family protein [Acidobacteriota bacterium]